MAAATVKDDVLLDIKKCEAKQHSPFRRGQKRHNTICLRSHDKFQTVRMPRHLAAFRLNQPRLCFAQLKGLLPTRHSRSPDECCWVSCVIHPVVAAGVLANLRNAVYLPTYARNDVKIILKKKLVL